MRLPHKILYLIDFLLEKRKKEDGYDTTFSFELQELNDEQVYPYYIDEVDDLLKAMTNTKVWIKPGEDPNEEKVEVKSLTDYKIDKEQKIITPIESNSKKLEALKIKVKKEQFKSKVILDYKNKTARWGENEIYKFSNTARWSVLKYLWDNFPEYVEYDKLFSQAVSRHLNEKQKRQSYKIGTQRQHSISNIIDGLIKKLISKPYNFPKDIIEKKYGISVKLNY